MQEKNKSIDITGKQLGVAVVPKVPNRLQENSQSTQIEVTMIDCPSHITDMYQRPKHSKALVLNVTLENGTIVSLSCLPLKKETVENLGKSICHILSDRQYSLSYDSNLTDNKEKQESKFEDSGDA